MGITTTIVALSIGTYAFWSLKTFITNVQQARRIGLPVILQPFHTMNLLYLLTCVFYKPIIDRLPFGLSEWKYLHFYYMDWACQTRDDQFEEYGNLIVTSSPGGNCLHVGDAEVASQVLTRRGDFPKDIKFYGSALPYLSPVDLRANPQRSMGSFLRRLSFNGIRTDHTLSYHISRSLTYHTIRRKVHSGVNTAK